MTFRTSWGISFHEYLVPLFSVRVSLRTQRTSSVDPERPSSGRPRPHPRKVQPYPVETQVDPGRIRVGEPDWPASGRPRLALIRPSSSRPRPARIRINRPGRIRGNSSKLRHIQVNSGQTQANPADKGKHKQLQHIHANTGKLTQTHANTGKLTQNSSIFKHEKGKETFEVHIRLSAGGASGAQPSVGAALQGCAGEVDSAHAHAQHRICR